MFENGVSDHWPSEQARNIELSVNKQETINYLVCHKDTPTFCMVVSVGSYLLALQDESCHPTIWSQCPIIG